MENILKDLGYKESKVNFEVSFFYQYKYYPIICIYQIITGYSNIFLQIRGYYIDNTKDEIIGILNEIIKFDYSSKQTDNIKEDKEKREYVINFIKRKEISKR